MATEPVSKHKIDYHDALTGETVTRELTADEIAALPKPTEPPAPAEPE